MSTQTVQQQVPTGTWTVDPVHSVARFEVGHGGIATFRGGFGEIAATLEGGDEPRLEGSVKVDSIEIEEPQLKGHLLSPDFFDAERYAEARFSSDAFEVSEDGDVEVRGALELRGETREVSARGHIASGVYLDGNERIGLSLETAVNRSDYGLNWQAELPGGGEALGYQVKIIVELELVKGTE